MWISVLLVATLVGCGSPAKPPPIQPVENHANATPPAPTKPNKSDPLGSFTTRTRPQAGASGTGSVSGSITNTMAEPLIGATLVFESTKLQGERVQITDEKGAFVLDAFPAGRYRVSVYYNDQTVRRSFEVEADRVTDLVLANWDEAFIPSSDPTPESALPEPGY